MLRTTVKRSLTAVIAIGVAVVLSSGGAAANAATTPDSSASELVWTTDNSPTGVAAAAAQARSANASAQAVTWASCGVNVDPNKVVRTFPNSTILRCGNSNFGYFHIKANHVTNQFDTLAAQTGQNWRDVADIGIEKAISNPAVVTTRPSNDTNCFSAVIYLVNVNNGQTVGTKIVRTVAGIRSNNITTAFPSDGHCTGNE